MFRNRTMEVAIFELSRSINNLAESINAFAERENEKDARLYNALNRIARSEQLICNTLEKVSRREKQIADMIKIVEY